MEVRNLFQTLQPRLKEYVCQTSDLQDICRFVGVVPRTVADWSNNRQPAKGVRLVRVWHFLAANGYESPELLGIPAFNRYVGELFAFSVISMKELHELAGVTSESASLRIMRGQPPMHPAMSLEDIKELYDERLQQLKQELKTKPTAADEPSVAPPTLPATTSESSAVFAPPQPSMMVGASADSKVYTLATLLGAALPLARDLSSDRCKPEDRALLRELMGEDGVFDLSNILNVLCGERARTHSRS